MTVLLSPVGGVAAQFFDNNGNPLSGGKLYSYAAGTTTPAVTYISSLGVTAHTNPIVLDSGGRVPGGEIWLTDGVIYKFVLETSTNVLIATYDNIVGINSNFVNFTAEQEIQTATAGQTVFNLTTTQYQPGTNSLTVYVDGVNQYGPGAQYAYLETDSDTVTFVSGLHVGASVKFTTATQTTGNATDASVVSYTPPFTGGVITNVEDKLAQYVSVKDFGAVGDGVTNDTAAMQAAHNTGKLVYYPTGTYNFTRITMTAGGITGDGKLSILRTTDTSSNDVITYTSVDPTGILINTVGGLFQNFTLLASTPTQKAAGAGIRISPANYGGSPNEDYLTICQGLYIRNIPIGISFTFASYFTVTNCSFAFFTVAGIYTDMNSALFQDNGDNTIIGNTFFTNFATSPSGRGIWYRAGGARIIGNKINGGSIGVDINPLRGTSIAVVEGNSIENQTVNAIRGYIGNDFTTISAFDGFSFLQFVGNQIGGYNLTGPAISVDSYASDPAFYNCSISDNIIFNPVDYGARAIDIRQVNRFIVSNNFVDNSGVGYGSLFVASSSTSGLVTRNQFLRANATYNSNILNSSTTTVIDEVVSQFSQSEAVGTIAAGGKYQVGYATKANLGDFVSASVNVDTGDCIIHAEVYALDAVRCTIYNPTASPIVVGNATVRVRVISN
jgi:hypothetical protein